MFVYCELLTCCMAKPDTTDFAGRQPFNLTEYEWIGGLSGR